MTHHAQITLSGTKVPAGSREVPGTGTSLRFPRFPPTFKGGGTREPVRSGGGTRCSARGRECEYMLEALGGGATARSRPRMPRGGLTSGAGRPRVPGRGPDRIAKIAVFGGSGSGVHGVPREPHTSATRVAAAPVRARVSIGIDQGGRSGWGIASGRTVIASGVATTHAQRLAVLELARARNGGTLKGVIVMFEDHGGMPLGRLTRDDHRTERRGPRRGAPERSTDSILGQGSNKGRWLECLDMLEHPKALRDKIKPHVWRAKLGIVGKLDTAHAKLAACQIASAAVGTRIDDHDQAEGVCLTLVAAIDGVARLEKRRAESRASARAGRQRARQGELFGGAK